MSKKDERGTEHPPSATVRRRAMVRACSSVSRLVARLRPALRAHGLDTACARDGLAAIGERPKTLRMDLKTEVSARIGFSRQPNHKPGGDIMKVVVKITPHDHGNLPTKLADAELHFTGGELDGLKLIGFSIWERRGEHGPSVSFPGRQHRIGDERRTFALLRPISDGSAHNRVRDLVLEAYAAFARNAGRAAMAGEGAS